MQSEQSDLRLQYIRLLSGFVVVGFGIGWLVGMALVPVVADLIANLVTFVILLLTALSGLEMKVPPPLRSPPAKETTATVNAPAEDAASVTDVPAGPLTKAVAGLSV